MNEADKNRLQQQIQNREEERNRQQEASEQVKKQTEPTPPPRPSPPIPSEPWPEEPDVPVEPEEPEMPDSPSIYEQLEEVMRQINSADFYLYTDESLKRLHEAMEMSQEDEEEILAKIDAINGAIENLEKIEPSELPVSHLETGRLETVYTFPSYEGAREYIVQLNGEEIESMILYESINELYYGSFLSSVLQDDENTLIIEALDENTGKLIAREAIEFNVKKPLMDLETTVYHVNDNKNAELRWQAETGISTYIVYINGEEIRLDQPDSVGSFLYKIGELEASALYSIYIVGVDSADQIVASTFLRTDFASYMNDPD